MRFNVKHSEPQNTQSEKCFRLGETQVESVCWYCESAVVGVTVRDQTGKYSMECKSCGYSGIADFNDPVFQRNE